MAEFVGYKQEFMLPVYEEMKRRKLVSDQEIREIIKTREAFEYKLNRQVKSIESFGEYIVYERQLLSTMAKREEKRNPTKSTDGERKFGPVENFIATHIKSLYKQALHLFPEEPRLWESYLKFCKSCNYFIEISNAFEKMLQYHGNEITIWLRAIEWEFKNTGNMDKVKDLFLRGIQRHPENEDLHLEFFRIMLSEAAKMSTDLILENNTISERDIGLKRVEVIYHSSRQKICNVKYLIDILNILEEYEFTKNLQKIVIEDMMNSFPREELVWHTFALREFRGLNISDLLQLKGSEKSNESDKEQEQQQQQQQQQPQQESNEKSVNEENVAEGESSRKGNEENIGAMVIEEIEKVMSGDASEKSTGENDGGNEKGDEVDKKPQITSASQAPKASKRTLKRRIELCCGVYEAAVKTLKTEKMWTYYINKMLELNHDMSTQQALKRQKLSLAFKGAYEAELLSESHFESYIELLKESDTKKEILEEVMKKGTMLHPSSVRLWELWMEYYAIEDDVDKVYEIFRKATKKLASEAFPLWKMLISYYLTRYDMASKLDAVFKEAAQFTQPNYLKLRVQYLEWTLLNKNIEKARQLYDELTMIYPPYYDLHYTMALLESKRIKPDIERWRKCHENIIHYFGKERTDIWINYIKFERDHGEPKRMSILHERAKNTLDTNLINQFISEYSYLTTGIM